MKNNISRIDAVMSVLQKYVVPEDKEELRAMIMAHSCPIEQWRNCTKDKTRECRNNANVTIRCWRGSDEDWEGEAEE